MRNVILISIVFIVLIAVLVWLVVTHKKRRQKITAKKENDLIAQNYLTGKYIRNGDFTGLKTATLEHLIKFNASLTCELSFLLIDYPEKILDFLNLGLEPDKINYIEKIITSRINFAVDLTIDAAVKVLEREEGEQDLIWIIVYFLEHLTEEKKMPFKIGLENKVKEAGGYFHISLANHPEGGFMYPEDRDSMMKK